jgi:hypothetical protein
VTVEDALGETAPLPHGDRHDRENPDTDQRRGLTRNRPTTSGISDSEIERACFTELDVQERRPPHQEGDEQDAEQARADVAPATRCRAPWRTRPRSTGSPGQG